MILRTDGFDLGFRFREARDLHICVFCLGLRSHRHSLRLDPLRIRMRGIRHLLKQGVCRFSIARSCNRGLVKARCKSAFQRCNCTPWRSFETPFLTYCFAIASCLLYYKYFPWHAKRTSTCRLHNRWSSRRQRQLIIPKSIPLHELFAQQISKFETTLYKG